MREECSLLHFALSVTGEDEINAFIPEEYWSLDATVDVEGEKKPITAKLYGRGDNKIAISSKDEMDKVLNEIKGKDCKVQNIKKDSAAIKLRFLLRPVLCSRRLQRL